MGASGNRENGGPARGEEGAASETDAPPTERPGAPSLPALPLAATGALVALLALVAAVTVTGGRREEPRRDPPRALPTESAPTPIVQAPWRIKSVPANVSARVTKSQRRGAARQARRISVVLKEIYGALFLRPESRPEVLRSRSTSSAARALRRSGAGLPGAAERVRAVKRRARISVDPLSPRRAVGSVALRVRGRLDGDLVRLEHSATLWLERAEGRWKVIAFELDQRPVKPR